MWMGEGADRVKFPVTSELLVKVKFPTSQGSLALVFQDGGHGKSTTPEQYLTVKFPTRRGWGRAGLAERASFE